ncbi:MAG: SAM-dependent methyltransferase, partial [Planctomycetes bacterium]|nr:SAM-dependent methyltransferase [Planctomycetota bacterium]
MRSFNFIRQFITHPTQTGAIWPSSVELAHVITDAASLSGASVIAEWGSGTGVF